MNLARLALKNMAGSAFRSTVVFLCAMVVAGFALATVLLVHGAQQSLQLVLERLGADIVVVPEGAQAEVETALLMGRPTEALMPAELVAKIGARPGVAAASPQLYLASLDNAACCAVSRMFMMIYDPRTDFTVTPWLKKRLGHPLGLGQVVGGTYVFVPEGEENIRLYGYHLSLKGNLEPTGTALDQTIFLTMETARDMARISRTLAVQPLKVPEGSVSAALVKLAQGADRNAVAVDLLQNVPGVAPIQSLNLFQAFRRQITGLLKGMLAVLGTTLFLSLLLIGLVFSMAANERRREIAVLRALGATQGAVSASLLLEAIFLALAGACVGIGLASLAIFLFRDLIVRSLAMPFLFPSVSALALLIGGGMTVALAGVTLAALLPAVRISRQEPALAMRE